MKLAGVLSLCLYLHFIKNEGYLFLEDYFAYALKTRGREREREREGGEEKDRCVREISLIVMSNLDFLFLIPF